MAANASRLALAALLAAACGGIGEEEPLPVPLGAQRAAQAADSAAVAQTPGSGPLVREVFAYAGGSRDPFESVLDQANVGPELPDLSLVGVYLDLQNSARNVAVLRERITGRRYTVYEGDRLGRLQVLSIREREVTFLVDDFGVERRESLTFRKPQEGDTP